MENLESIIYSNKVVILTDSDSETFYDIKNIFKKYSLTDLGVFRLDEQDKIHLCANKIEIPIVFVDGFPLGGYEELKSMDLSGNLRIVLKITGALKFHKAYRKKKNNIFTACFG